MIGSLLWKEWREQRWKVVGIFLVYAALVAAAYVAAATSEHWKPGEASSMAQGCILGMCFLVPGFVAMGTITQERARRTEETLRALPVEGVPLFCSRMAGGLAAMLLPLGAIQGVCWLLAPGGVDSVGMSVAAGEAGLMVSLYLWTLALGARLRSEAAMGLMSLGILLGCGFIVSAASIFQEGMPANSLGEDLQLALMQLLPTGFATILDTLMPPAQVRADRARTILCVILQGLEWGPLVMFTYWRMNSPAQQRAPQSAARRGAPAFPAFDRRQRFPILWKTWRESRLLLLGFAAAATCFVMATGSVMWWAVHRAVGAGGSSPPILAGASSHFIEVLPGLGAVLATIIMGVDIGMRDFENRLETFWQSRPIAAAHYMQRRFWLGFALLLPALLWVSALGFLYFLATRLLFPDPEVWSPVLREWRPKQYYSLYAYQVAGDAGEFLVFFVPQAFVIYGFSVLCATLTRRRVISLTLGIGGGMGLQMLFALADMQPTVQLIKQQALFTAGYWVMMLALTAGLGWLSMLSVKWDWRAWFEQALTPRASSEAIVTER